MSCFTDPIDLIEFLTSNLLFVLAGKFLSALAKEGMINESVLSDQELGVIYGPLREQVNDSIHRQETVLANVQVRLPLNVYYI